MEDKLKIGDLLYCHTACIMNNSGHITTTVGKSYIIDAISYNGYRITDDENDDHYFPFNEYEKFFYSNIKKIRKEKLSKIYESNLH